MSLPPTVTVQTSGVHSPPGDPFTATLTGWSPYGGAGCFGLLEMDMWALALLHHARAAAADGHPTWVLTLPADVDLSGHEATSPVPVTSARYDGGLLDPYRVAGLLIDVDGTLRPSDEVYAGDFAGADHGSGDPTDAGSWPAP